MKSLTKNDLEFIKGGEVDCTKKIEKAVNDLIHEFGSLRWVPHLGDEIAIRTNRCYTDVPLRRNSKYV